MHGDFKAETGTGYLIDGGVKMIITQALVKWVTGLISCAWLRSCVITCVNPTIQRLSIKDFRAFSPIIILDGTVKSLCRNYISTAFLT